MAAVLQADSASVVQSLLLLYVDTIRVNSFFNILSIFAKINQVLIKLDLLIPEFSIKK